MIETFQIYNTMPWGFILFQTGNLHNQVSFIISYFSATLWWCTDGHPIFNFRILASMKIPLQPTSFRKVANIYMLFMLKWKSVEFCLHKLNPFIKVLSIKIFVKLLLLILSIMSQLMLNQVYETAFFYNNIMSR